VANSRTIKGARPNACAWPTKPRTRLTRPHWSKWPKPGPSSLSWNKPEARTKKPNSAGAEPQVVLRISGTDRRRLAFSSHQYAGMGAPALRCPLHCRLASETFDSARFFDAQIKSAHALLHLAAGQARGVKFLFEGDEHNYFGIMKSCELEPLQSLRGTRSFLDKQEHLGRGGIKERQIAFPRS
jgi:hypothetical protein